MRSYSAAVDGNISDSILHTEENVFVNFGGELVWIS